MGLSLVLEPQPAGQPSYVTTEEGKGTVYLPVYVPDSKAVLVHNYLGGDALGAVQVGDEISILGKESMQIYRVTAIHRFRAVDPNSPYSAMIDLDTGEALSPEQAYRRVYVSNILTLQTCISKDGNGSWGRLFVQAEMVNELWSLSPHNILRIQ